MQIQSFEVVRAQRLRSLLRGTTRLIRFGVMAALGYAWLQFVLGRFPVTRPLAARLLQLLLDPLGRLASGLVAQLPSLAFLLVLFFLTRWTLRLVKLFFESVEKRQVELSGFEPEWAMPTYRIVRVAIVAFALVVAYPYIPGSHSAAFQSISLFLGVMFSIGSSSFVVQRDRRLLDDLQARLPSGRPDPGGGDPGRSDRDPAAGHAPAHRSRTKRS